MTETPRPPMLHELKTWPEFYEALASLREAPVFQGADMIPLTPARLAGIREVLEADPNYGLDKAEAEELFQHIDALTAERDQADAAVKSGIAHLDELKGQVMEARSERDALTAEVAALRKVDDAHDYWQARAEQAETIAGDAHAEIERLVAHAKALTAERDEWKNTAQVVSRNQLKACEERDALTAEVAALRSLLQGASGQLKILDRHDPHEAVTELLTDIAKVLEPSR